MFKQPPKIAGGMLLNLNFPQKKTSCQTEYAKDLQKRLKVTYQIDQKAIKKAEDWARGMICVSVALS